MSPDSFLHRYASLEELRSHYALHDERSLNIIERQELARWRESGRREVWFLARMLAKQLLAEHLGDPALPFGAIEIRSRDDRNRGIRPRIRIDGEAKPWAMSISHTDRGVLVGLSTVPGTLLGVDLTPVGVYRPSFLSIWFTERERIWLSNSEPEQIAAAWAVKEAVYKAANIGDSFAPQCIEVYPVDSGRYACIDRGIDLSRVCQVRTWPVDGQIAAAALLLRPEAGFQNGTKTMTHAAEAAGVPAPRGAVASEMNPQGFVR